MAEATTSAGAKPKAAKPVASFEIPRFEAPKFEIPKMEVPAAFREIAEKGISQAKENYDKVKAAAEGATDMLEETYATATKGATDYGLKLIETARSNTNAAFDFFGELLAVKSPSELIELTTAHTRKQFEALTAQGKELTALAQKVATDSSEPLKAGVSSAFKKVA
jgi:phasin